MIQYQLKLKLNKSQKQIIDEWFIISTGVWNWAIRKIELDAKDGIYHNKFKFTSLLTGHSQKLAIPFHTIRGIQENAYNSWVRCFKKETKKPKLKGHRNKLNSIPFPDPIKFPVGNKISILKLGKVKFHKQNIPDGKIKCGRLLRKASGYYFCIIIDISPKSIPVKANHVVGIDPGFKSLLTLSNGQKVDHPREYEQLQKRLAQAQRGHNKNFVARLQEHIANQKKDRNHKLSRQIIENNKEIYFSKDNIKNIAKKFGKSVNSSNIYQLRQMMAYKSTISGRKYIEVDCKNSTKTCSNCKALTGPAGWVGLSVRNWVCTACGAEHDRDINAAINTLNFGLGLSHESNSNITSEIPQKQKEELIGALTRKNQYDPIKIPG